MSVFMLGELMSSLDRFKANRKRDKAIRWLSKQLSSVSLLGPRIAHLRQHVELHGHDTLLSDVEVDRALVSLEMRYQETLGKIRDEKRIVESLWGDLSHFESLWDDMQVEARVEASVIDLDRSLRIMERYWYGAPSGSPDSL